MRYNTWSYYEHNLQNYTRYTHDVVRKVTFEALSSFRVLTKEKKNAAEAKEMICSVLGKNCIVQHM